MAHFLVVSGRYNVCLSLVLFPRCSAVHFVNRPALGLGGTPAAVCPEARLEGAAELRFFTLFGSGGVLHVEGHQFGSDSGSGKVDGFEGANPRDLSRIHPDGDDLADPHRVRRFDGLFLDFDRASSNRSGGEGPGFEGAYGPEPEVESHTGKQLQGDSAVTWFAPRCRVWEGSGFTGA